MSLESFIDDPKTPYGLLSIIVIIIGGGFFKYLTSRKKSTNNDSASNSKDPEIKLDIIEKQIEELKEQIMTNHLLIDKLGNKLAKLEGQVDVLRDK